MIYLNDKPVPENEARVSVFDHGFLYGDGCYETLRAYNGRVFMIEEHIQRLFDSADMIALKLPKSAGEIRDAVYETLRANGLVDAYIRITVSRGPGPPGLDPALCPAPTFVIMTGEFKKYPPRHYRKGVHVAIVRTRRNYRGALDPRIKSLNFLNNIQAKREAKERGAYEALMLNYRGYIAEGTISNVFFVKDDALFTPSAGVGILRGITRDTVLALSRELGIHSREGRYRREDLYGADEVFLTNTTMEVMPVSMVDDIRIPAPGKITKMLHKAYKNTVARYIKGAN